ncbi:uncharacterized protein LOC118200669 [Stegodyphus dumicola]|uniref:uncharacterized protein LOC118200669 n=1 Tax=Stegodyphus dumicola TaxID=202533 RepID=UPI0015B2671F|nr:uncharacterized protein LOC118200669 [Stegodyphus dumicola]
MHMKILITVLCLVMCCCRCLGYPIKGNDTEYHLIQNEEMDSSANMSSSEVWHDTETDVLGAIRKGSSNSGGWKPGAGNNNSGVWSTGANYSRRRSRGGSSYGSGAGPLPTYAWIILGSLGGVSLISFIIWIYWRYFREPNQITQVS